MVIYTPYTQVYKKCIPLRNHFARIWYMPTEALNSALIPCNFKAERYNPLMPTFNSKIIRSNRKTVSLRILSDASLLIKAPFRVSNKDIDEFIQKNLPWIQKQTSLKRQRKIDKEEKQELLFLGKPHKLEFGNYTSIRAHEDKILFPQALQFRMQKELTSWFIHQAQEIITKQVEWYALQMNVSYASISFSDTISRWGSCSHDNHLQFNWHLVQAPLLVINYVVVHELAHTQQKDHSAGFWSRVRLFSPSYRQQREWLKTHGSTLTT